jgi:2-oxoglutarate dehydrogenase E2 component (dihydrolipoamide succinyltransferase)
MALEIRIPHLGESITSGVITRWHKKSGDHVSLDDPLFELETDKAAMEIAAESSGRLEILTPEGTTVQVGAVVARITADGTGERSAAEPAQPLGERREQASATGDESPVKPQAASVRRDAPVRREDVPASGEAAPEPGPAVRKLVAEHRLDPTRIQGTGKDGRLTKGDVLEALERGDGTRREPMSRLRRVIAERLVEAQRTAAILTTFNEIDMTEVLALRRRHRERFREKHGVDLGLMSLFARASALALRAVPIVNAAIDGTDIVYHDAVHLGIAVSTPRGLVVPVVRNAQALSLAEVERAIAELAARAREGHLRPDDLIGGTFTITNGGVFGSLLSTPILNPPQAGILGMHKIEERPVAVQGQVVVHPMMYVALSYDHRLVDGEQAVTFLVRVKEQLEDPARMLLDV